MKYTKEITAQVSRAATHAWFVEGKESGLLKLIEIIQSIFLRRVRNFNIPSDVIEESLQELTVRIMKTLPSYNIDKATETSSFVTYFHMQISGHIQRLVHSQKYPHMNAQLGNEVHVAKIIYTKTEEEIQELIADEKSSISQTSYDRVLGLMNTRVVRFDTTTDSDDDNDTFGAESFVFDEEALSMEDSVNSVEAIHFLHKAIEHLDERIGKAVIYYYIKGMTLDEVAAIYGVTSERIRQRCAQGVREIRNYIRHDCDDYDFHKISFMDLS